MKGKDMHVSDFLSRHPGEGNTPQNEIIPISFDVMDIAKNQSKLHAIHQVLTDEKLLMIVNDTVNVMTRRHGKVPSIYPLRGEHRLPEHVPETHEEKEIEKLDIEKEVFEPIEVVEEEEPQQLPEEKQGTPK